MRVVRTTFVVLFTIAVCLLLARAGLRWWIIHHTEAVVRGYGGFDELLEEAVVARLGLPIQDMGYLITLGPPGRGPYPPAGENRTLVYRTQDGLRLDSGTLYIYLEHRDVKRRCSGSVWFRDGVVF